jgi:hypothetical protein
VAIGAVGTFSNGAFLGREAADTFVFFAELFIGGVACRANPIFFFGGGGSGSRAFFGVAKGHQGVSLGAFDNRALYAAREFIPAARG